MPSWVRSVLAVVAGALVIGALHTGTDMVLQNTGVVPPFKAAAALAPRYLLLAVFYRSVIDVLGGFITGQVAPNRPQFHALILGGIGLVLNIAGGIAMWHLGAHWYPAVLTVLALPSTWLGGWLAQKTRST